MDFGTKQFLKEIAIPIRRVPRKTDESQTCTLVTNNTLYVNKKKKK